MTFYISKIFWLVAQPLSLAFFLIVAGLLAGFLKWNRIRTLSSVLAALVLFLTLFTTTGAVLLQTLEDRIPRAALPEGGPACIITLGGGFEADVTTARGGYEMNQAGDRFVETLRLAREFPQARILISGGDGSLSGDFEGDAVIGSRFLAAFGIPETRLIREGDRATRSRMRITRRRCLPKTAWNAASSSPRPFICRARSGSSANAVSRCCPGRPISVRPARRASAST